jgi:hypothetical protein
MMLPASGIGSAGRAIIGRCVAPIHGCRCRLSPPSRQATWSSS